MASTGCFFARLPGKGSSRGLRGLEVCGAFFCAPSQDFCHDPEALTFIGLLSLNLFGFAESLESEIQTGETL